MAATQRARTITELAAVTSAASNDAIAIVANTSGTAATRRITVGDLLGNASANVCVRSIATPANSTVTTVKAGTILYDSNYLYVAVANNNLKRVALETF